MKPIFLGRTYYNSSEPLTEEYAKYYIGLCMHHCATSPYDAAKYEYALTYGNIVFETANVEGGSGIDHYFCVIFQDDTTTVDFCLRFDCQELPPPRSLNY